MPLTVPTAFSENQYRTGLFSTPILVISGNAFGYTDMRLTDVSANAGVFPFLKSGPSYSFGFDPMRKRSQISDMTATLNNSVTFNHPSTGPITVDSLLSSAQATPVYVYWALGNQVTSLSDCLLGYQGVIVEIPQYNIHTVTIHAVSAESKTHIALPENIVGDVFSDVSEADAQKPIPIVYGEFTKAFTTTDTGLAPAVRTANSDGLYPKYTVADHALDALSQDFVKHKRLDEPTETDSSTLTVDDSGRGTIQFAKGVATPEIPTGMTRLFPSGDYAGDLNIKLRRGQVLNFGNISDKDATTYASVMDVVDTSVPGSASISSATNATPIVVIMDALVTGGSHIYISGVEGNTAANGFWDITWVSSSPPTYSLNNSVGNGAYTTGGTAVWGALDQTIAGYLIASFKDFSRGSGQENDIGNIVGTQIFSAIVDEGSVDMGSPAQCIARIYFDQISGTDQYWNDGVDWLLSMNGSEDTETFTRDKSELGEIGFAMLTGHTNVANNENYPHVAVLFFESEEWADLSGNVDSPNGIVGDSEMGKVYDLHLEIRHTIPRIEDQEVFAACNGKECGSWLNGRNGYSTGDVITHPAYIIESILRDHLGLSSEIDTDSFDDAAGADSIDTRISIGGDGKIVNSDKVIQALVEQSTFGYGWSANGTVVLIPMDATSWAAASVDRTIPWSHIVDGDVKVKYSKPFVNNIIAKNCWLAEYDRYRQVDLFSDSGSISTYGEKPYKAKWGNIAGSDVTTVGEHYIDDGLWTDKHPVIEIRTLGQMYADLIQGDYIALDATSVDPHLRFYGVSWASRKFMVTNITQSPEQTVIKAMALY